MTDARAKKASQTSKRPDNECLLNCVLRDTKTRTVVTKIKNKKRKKKNKV